MQCNGSEAVMANLHCQFDGVESNLRDAPLGVPVRVSPEWFKLEWKTHLECRVASFSGSRFQTKSERKKKKQRQQSELSISIPVFLLPDTGITVASQPCTFCHAVPAMVEGICSGCQPRQSLPSLSYF